MKLLNMTEDEIIYNGDYCPDDIILLVRDANKMKKVLGGKIEALEADKLVLQTAMKMLMKAIPEKILPDIPDHVKLACLINLEEYDQATSTASDD